MLNQSNQLSNQLPEGIGVAEAKTEINERQLRARLQITLKLLKGVCQEKLFDSPKILELNEEILRTQRLLQTEKLTAEQLHNLLEHYKLYFFKFLDGV